MKIWGIKVIYLKKYTLFNRMHSHGIVIELSSERVNDGIDKPKQLIVTFQNLLEHERMIGGKYFDSLNCCKKFLYHSRTNLNVYTTKINAKAQMVKGRHHE